MAEIDKAIKRAEVAERKNIAHEATIEKQKQIPISVISDALGHDSEKTTLIYLSTLDTSEVYNANSVILAALGEW